MIEREIEAENSSVQDKKDQENEMENEQLNKEDKQEIKEEAPVLEPVENYPFLPQFEFDAPRYKNFCLKKWRPTRKLLNKIVLKIEESEEEEEEDEEVESTSQESAFTDGVTEEFSFLMNFEDAEHILSKSSVDEGETDYEELDAWFNRFHPLHEPLRPMTPPGPLLSPERSSTQHRPLRSFAFQPRSSTGPSFASPTRSSITGPSITTPLRPVASSPLKQPLSSPKYSPKHSPLSSPIKSRLLSSPVRNFSPLTRISFLNSSPTRSPLTAAPFAVAPVKIGLKAKAARVLKPESQDSSPIEPVIVKPIEPESLKRMHSETQIIDHSKRPKLKSSNVDLDDIKKLLNQHNNRIRPRSNNKR